MTDKDLEMQELRRRVADLERENERMRQQIGAYVTEFRVCRFCANLHGDCDPNSYNCIPQWSGL